MRCQARSCAALLVFFCISLFQEAGAQDYDAPSAPAGLSASVTPGGIALTWAPNTEGDLAGYSITRASDEGIVHLAAPIVASAQFTDGAVLPGLTYRYAVRAVDSDGNVSEFSSVVTIAVPLGSFTPPPVSSLQADSLKQNITLVWDDYPSAVRYHVYRALPGGLFQPLASVPVSSNRYIDRSPPATGCRYLVRAVLPDGSETPEGAPVESATAAKPVLLVDADPLQGDEALYKQALSASHSGRFDLWRTDVHGTPRPADLSSYRAVLWHAGTRKFPALTPEEVHALRGYLSRGGALLLSARHLLAGLYRNEINFATGRYRISDFAQGDLGIVPPFPPPIPLRYSAPPGLAEPDYAGLDIGLRNASLPDLDREPYFLFQSAAPAEGVLADASGSFAGSFSALKRDFPEPGRGRVLYWAFGLEDLDSQSSSQDLIGRTLSWLEGAEPLLWSRPRHGDTGAGTNVSLDFGLRIPLDAATLAGNVSLRDSTGAEVPARAAYHPGQSVVRVEPMQHLPAGASYMLRIDTGLKDIHGRSVGPLDITFATGAGPDTGAPPAPAAPRVDGAGTHDGAVAIGLPDLPSGDAAFAVFRREAGHTSWTQVNDGPVRATLFIDGAVADGVFYEYALAAEDAAGNRSGTSNTALARSPDTLAPELSLAAPAQDARGFYRTQDSTIRIAGTVDDPAAAVTIDGAPVQRSGADWFVPAFPLAGEGLNGPVLRAVDAAGNVRTITLNIIRDTSATKPGPIRTVATSPTGARIEWPFSGETDLMEHRIERRPANASDPASAWQPIGRAPVPAMFFEDAAAASAPSCYRVTSADNLGNTSPQSDEVCPAAFGAGIAGRTGRSYDPDTGVNEIPVATPSPVTPHAPVNQVGVRYISDHTLWAYEWPHAPYSLSASMPFIIIENSAGFGSTGTIVVKLPKGLGFDPATMPYGTPFVSWGTYPANPPQYVLSPPHWDTTRMLDGLNTQFTVLSATEQEIRYSFQTFGHVIGSDANGNPILSGPANLKALMLWDLQFRGVPVAWEKLQDPFLPIEISINGAAFEPSLRYHLDRDPGRLASLRAPIDDHGGHLDILTGDYSFAAPLFSGSGFGLNVDGTLSYSSRRALFDRAALRRGNPESYASTPLGFGWRYPYGLKIMAHSRKRLENGQLVHEEPNDLLLIAPGGEHYQFAHYDYSANPLIHEGVTYTRAYQPRERLIGQIEEPLILPRPGGGYWLVEARPETFGFTRYEFDADGRLSRIVPHGGAAPLEIAYKGSVQEVTDSSGRVTKFHFGGASRIERIEDPAGGVWLLAYAGDVLTSVREQDTGYGWSFSYDPDHGMLTERQLPHGFTIRASYDTADAAAAERFIWGSLSATQWKGVADSQRRVRYRRGQGDSTAFPDRVSVTTPSGRNALHYDLGNHADFLNSPWSLAQVLLFDEDETSPGTLRALGRREAVSGLYLSRDEDAMGFGMLLDNQSTVANSTIVDLLTFPDGTHISQPSVTGGPTLRSPSQIRGVAGFSRFTYRDPRTRFERVEGSYPFGQDPADSHAKRTFFEYDAQFRPVRIRSVHGHTTRLVYDERPNAGQVRVEVRCAGELPSFTTTTRDPFRWTRTYDGLGRILKETDPDGFTTTLVYDKAGRLIEQRGPEHPASSVDVPVVAFTYDGDLLTGATFRDAAGGQERTETYVYNAKGALIEKQFANPKPDGSLNRETFEYDADGHLRFRRWSSAAGPAVEEYVYDNRGNLRKVISAEGESVEYDYDGGDVLKQIRQAGPGPARVWDILDRDALGNPLEIELPEVTQGGVTGRPRLKYVYEDGVVLKELIYSFGGERRKSTFSYDAFGGMVRQVLEMEGGQEIELAYARDDVGKLLQTMGPALTAASAAGPIVRQAGRTRRTVVNVETDCFGNAVRFTDLSRDERLAVARDINGLPSKLSQPDPSRRQAAGTIAADTPALEMRLNALGLPAGVEDLFGNRTRFTQDVYGREMRLLSESGAAIESVYNAGGDLESATMTLPEGGKIGAQATYDEAGDVTSIRGPGDSRERRFEYDKSGRLKKLIDADGKETSFVYNAYGDLERKVLPNGQSVVYERDALGRVTKVSEYGAGGALAKATVWEYDRLGRLAVQDDGYYRSESKFDKLGRIVEKKMTFVRVKLTETLKYTWGEYGNLVSVEDSAGYILVYRWDNEDNLVDIDVTAQGLDHGIHRQADRVGVLHRWEYRNAGSTQVTATIQRDRKGRPTELGYDAPDSRGIQARYEYDGLDRIVRADYGHRGLTARYAYDGRGFLIGEQWRQADGTPVSTERIEYDQAGNRVRHDRNGRISSYHYDGNAKLTVVRSEDVVKLAPALISVRADSEFSQDYAAQWVVDGRKPDSVAPRHGWRSAVTDVEHWVELDLGSIRPVAALDVSFPTARGGVDGFHVEWRDPARGLVDVVRPSAVYHGARRNAETVTTNRHTVRLVFSPPLLAQHLRVVIPRDGAAWNPLTGTQDPDVMINEICVFLPEHRTIAQQFDEAGRLIASGQTTFEYDVEGRLTRMRGPNVDRTWQIGPNGQAVAEADHMSGSTRYFFGNGPNVFSEFVADHSATVPRPAIKHFSGLGADTHLGFATYDAIGQPTFHWQFREGPGSVAQVRSADGELLDDFLTSAWGEPVGPSFEASQNPYGFSGRRRLPNGFYDHRARIYDPATGRFASRDPLGFAEGGSPYAYAGNDPVNSIDLMGFVPWRQRAEAFGGVFYGFGRAIYKYGEGAGTVFVGGAAKLLGADRNGYFKDVLRKHDQLVDGLADMIVDPTVIVTGPMQAFENAIANADAFEAGAVVGETSFQVITAAEGAAEFVGRTVPNLLARTRSARPRLNVPCKAGSFPAGTQVLTPAGARAIETLVPGDRVLTRDDVSGAFGERIVTSTHARDGQPLVRVHFRRGATVFALEATSEHPLWVQEQGWKMAGALRESDVLYGHDGAAMEVVRVEAPAGLHRVYNLAVAEFESFFVGDGAAWVHNITPCQRLDLLNRLRTLRRDLNSAFREHPDQFVPGEGTLAVMRVTFRWGEGYLTEFYAGYSGMSKLMKYRHTRALEERFTVPRRDFMRSAKRKGRAESYVDSPNGRYPHHVEPKLLDSLLEHVNFDDIHSVALLIERAPCSGSCGTRVLPSWITGRVPHARGNRQLLGQHGAPALTQKVPTEIYHLSGPGGRRIHRWVH